MRTKLYLSSTLLCLNLGIAFGLFSQSPVFAQTAAQVRASKQEGRVNNADQCFVMDAAEAGSAEVAHSQLAVTRASNEEVKTFAQRMVDDHTKVNQELRCRFLTEGLCFKSLADFA